MIATIDDLRARVAQDIVEAKASVVILSRQSEERRRRIHQLQDEDLGIRRRRTDLRLLIERLEQIHRNLEEGQEPQALPVPATCGAAPEPEPASEYGEDETDQRVGVVLDIVAQEYRVSPTAFVVPGGLPRASRDARRTAICALIAMGVERAAIINRWGIDERTIQAPIDQAAGNPAIAALASDIAARAEEHLAASREEVPAC